MGRAERPGTADPARAHGRCPTAWPSAPTASAWPPPVEDDTAKVWDAQTGKELLTLQGHTDSVDGVAFSPDGKRLATASR